VVKISVKKRSEDRKERKREGVANLPQLMKEKEKRKSRKKLSLIFFLPSSNP